MTVCPKCGYERTPNDDVFISTEECPKCGIFYKKWIPPTDYKNTESVLRNNEVLNVNKAKKPIPYKSAFAFAIIFILLAVIVKFTFYTRDESSVSTLPVTQPLGTDSLSYIIRASGDEGTITAAGQLFKPPLQAPILLKLGFLFTQPNSKVPDFKLRVMLSEWDGDRPHPKALWISEPCAIPRASTDFQNDWMDFDLPPLILKPNKLYVAWITLSGLENPPDAIVGIRSMGPRYTSDRRYIGSPYPEGMCTFYKQANPYGDVAQMKNSAWEVYDVGSNLHFRMSFESSTDKHAKKELENNDSEKRLNEIIQQKTEQAIALRNTKELQKHEEMRGQQEERERQQQEEAMIRQIEMEQQQEAMRQQQITREQEQEKKKQQQIEREIQQSAIERQREQEQNEMQYQHQDARLNRDPRRVHRLYKRR